MMTLRKLYRRLVNISLLYLLLVAIFFFAYAVPSFISLDGVVAVKDFVLSSAILSVSFVYLSNKSVKPIWHDGGVN